MRIIWDFLRPPQDGLREVVGGELHRCNGGMEQIRVLSRDLHTLNYKDLGSGGTAAMTLSQSISHVCFHHIAMDSCGRGRFQCADGWFDYDIIRSADDYCSGFVSGHTKSEAYQFYRERGADPVLKKLGSEPQLLGTLTGNGTFDCKKIANYKQLTKDNFFIIPKTVRARFNAPGGTDSSNMGWNSIKELKSIEYNADTGILSFYLTTSDSYSYGSYWTKSYSIEITGDLYCVF